MARDHRTRHYADIHFVELPPAGTWECRTKKDNHTIGEVEWAKREGQYVYYPMAHDGPVYNAGVLNAIVHFLMAIAEEGAP